MGKYTQKLRANIGQAQGVVNDYDAEMRQHAGLSGLADIAGQGASLVFKSHQVGQMRDVLKRQVATATEKLASGELSDIERFTYEQQIANADLANANLNINTTDSFFGNQVALNKVLDPSGMMQAVARIEAQENYRNIMARLRAIDLDRREGDSVVRNEATRTKTQKDLAELEKENLELKAKQAILDESSGKGGSIRGSIFGGAGDIIKRLSGATMYSAK